MLFLSYPPVGSYVSNRSYRLEGTPIRALGLRADLSLRPKVRQAILLVGHRSHTNYSVYSDRKVGKLHEKFPIFDFDFDNRLDNPPLRPRSTFPTHTAIMADAAPRRGGFGSRGDRGGDRGRGRGRRGRRGGAKSEEKEWQPVTKLGRLVKAGKITSMEQIYLHSLPVKEYQIVDFFLPKLKDEVMKVRLIDMDYRCWIRRSQLKKGN